MSEVYDPLRHSIVQAAVGTWQRYECDDFVEAIFDSILAEIKRVHWNVYQHQWGPSWHYDEIEDPEIDGISFTRYYDGCQCKDESNHDADCRHSRPNFQHEDVKICWYKYPGRGMSTNKDWGADEWRAWQKRCLGTIREFEGDHYSDANRKRQDGLRAALRARFPKAFDVKTDDREAAAFRAFFSAFDKVDKAHTPCWKCSESGVFGKKNKGGGVWESGNSGTIARTLHVDDDPNGPCVNCGHVNTEAERKQLDERRRKNSDEDKKRWAEMAREENNKPWAIAEKVSDRIVDAINEELTAMRIKNRIEPLQLLAGCCLGTMAYLKTAPPFARPSSLQRMESAIQDVLIELLKDVPRTL